MNGILILSLFGLSLFSSHWSTGASSTTSYQPVESLNLSQYDGLWYEVYGDLADRAFQGFGTCITAEYTIQGENNVSVYNREIRKNGTVDTIEGYAFYQDNATGGELTVYLEGTPSNAPYWVLELGPVVDEEYAYAIVSDDKQLTLFVLARNVSDYFELYDERVLQSLNTLGFTKKINEPQLIEQYTTCIYTDDDDDDDDDDDANDYAAGAMNNYADDDDDDDDNDNDDT